MSPGRGPSVGPRPVPRPVTRRCVVSASSASGRHRPRGLRAAGVRRAGGGLGKEPFTLRWSLYSGQPYLDTARRRSRSSPRSTPRLPSSRSRSATRQGPPSSSPSWSAAAGRTSSLPAALAAGVGPAGAAGQSRSADQARRQGGPAGGLRARADAVLEYAGAGPVRAADVGLHAGAVLQPHAVPAQGRSPSRTPRGTGTASATRWCS